tara:strand:- start:307 stop:798 length:492 start_codon:yes stop_codon:yes gene_type:complete
MKNLKKIASGVSDYFLGFGSGNYIKKIEFCDNYLKEPERSNKKEDVNLNQFYNVLVRTSMTALESFVVYNLVKHNQPISLPFITLPEVFRWISIYLDRKDMNEINQEKLEIETKWLDDTMTEYNEKQKLREIVKEEFEKDIDASFNEFEDTNYGQNAEDWKED